MQPLLAVIARRALEPGVVAPRPEARGSRPLLNSFTDALRSPKRGYAIVRLALDLGLRSTEITRLQLDDIDWRMGTVTLKRTKSQRQDLLPLPVATGRGA